MPEIDHNSQIPTSPVVPAESGCPKEKNAEDQEVSLPVALRPITLTVDAARKIEQLLDDPEQPAHEGREMPSADASALRRKDR